VNAQSFLHPLELFTDEPHLEARPWACVRTRARFEKQFCQWLRTRGVAHFLPTSHESKVCGRTRYTVDAPLFPGYVFLVGDYDKSALKEACCVVSILRPPLGQTDRLERDLWTIWRGLVSGSRLELSRKLVPGDLVEVKTGPFVGMQGRFEKWGKGGWLHVWLDLLGCGASVLLPEMYVTRSLG